MAKKETKTNKKENNKNKKSFFKDFKAELKKVVWPTPKQLLNNTVAVITIVLITAAIVFVLDFAFESVNKHGIDKIKGIINKDTSTTENVETDTNAVTDGTETNNVVEENAPEEQVVEGQEQPTDNQPDTENNVQ